MRNLRSPFYLLLIVVSFVALFSCVSDIDDYSTNPGDAISFSTDTLSFDTIFSTAASTTKEFKVYNKNKKALLISSVSLQNADQTGFRMNVNGLKGTTVENVEVLGEDSITIFVETTLKPNGGNIPIQVVDEVVFITNGVQQKVILEAYGQDAYVWKGHVIENSETLLNEKPYLIYDSLIINEGAQLTIPAGTNIYLHSKAKIRVCGNIKVEGTLQAPVVFRGDRLDDVANVPYDRTPGQWSGIYFAPTSYDNELEYANIRNCSYGLYFEQSDPEKLKLKMKNTVVTNSSDTLFTAYNCHIEAENCEFSNAAGLVMYLSGGKYNFVHTTIANYFSWNIQGLKGSIALSNGFRRDKEDDVALPLTQADFLNSLVVSTGTGIIIDKVDSTATFNYMFQNCLLKASEKEIGSSTSNCLFNVNPRFANLNKDKDMYYDFRLDSISPARNVADPSITTNYGLQYDMNNIYRFNDEGPDMGTYEWISTYQ